MRLLTLNSHSLIEDNYEDKLNKFCCGVGQLMPHVIALQEVNQSIGGDCADNHILRVYEILKKRGINYHYVWRGMKESYGMYEEGLGILARDEISDVDFVPLTEPRNDWKMRYTLGVKVKDLWFYSVHTGRWDDSDEPFWGQIEKLREAVR